MTPWSWVVIDGAALEDVARYRIRVRNNDGDVLSERIFGRLEGDVDKTASSKALVITTSPYC